MTRTAKATRNLDRRFSREAAKTKLACVTARAITEIEKVQPYYARPDWRKHPLWVLHELERVDKHRRLHVVLSAPEGVWLDPPPPGVGWNIEYMEGGADVLEGRTELKRYRAFLAGTNEPTEVNLRPALRVVFEKGPPAYEGAVVETLTAIRDCITDTVIPPLRPFL